ncbi:hypothetical protein J9303_13925 [Bacillaceae bacterium Marseille-Q3522]|nr:hypothetical protein [Bacillaceae bacterium Marseille-Q3522]
MSKFLNQYLRSIRLDKDNIPSIDEYPFYLPSIKTLTELTFHPHVTYLVGENGMGKSTLFFEDKDRLLHHLFNS